MKFGFKETPSLNKVDPRYIYIYFIFSHLDNERLMQGPEFENSILRDTSFIRLFI